MTGIEGYYHRATVPCSPFLACNMEIYKYSSFREQVIQVEIQLMSLILIYIRGLELDVVA